MEIENAATFVAWADAQGIPRGSYTVEAMLGQAGGVVEWDEKAAGVPMPAADTAAKWAETYVAPAEPDHVAEVDAKLEAAKAGTQGDKIIALRESVEALTAALKAKRVI